MYNPEIICLNINLALKFILNYQSLSHNYFQRGRINTVLIIGINGEGNNQQGEILMDARQELRRRMTSKKMKDKTQDNNNSSADQHCSTMTRNIPWPDNNDGNQDPSRKQNFTKSKKKGWEKTYSAVVKTGTTTQWDKDCRPVAINYGKG